MRRTLLPAADPGEMRGGWRTPRMNQAPSATPARRAVTSAARRRFARVFLDDAAGVEESRPAPRLARLRAVTRGPEEFLRYTAENGMTPDAPRTDRGPAHFEVVYTAELSDC